MPVVGRVPVTTPMFSRVWAAISVVRPTMVNALPVSDPEQIKANLNKQLTSPVRWTATVQNMLADGAEEFIEVGPGTALQGMIKRVKADANAYSATI